MSDNRPIREDREVNVALHVWLDAPGIWDELVHITDPDAGFSDELREAAAYLMTCTPSQIERVGWNVLEHDSVWDAINRAMRDAIIETAAELKASKMPVVSSGDAQDQA